MYNGFYNLKENPFRLTPDPAYLYMTAQHREALSALVYNCCTRPGLAVLLGEAGTGKSTVLCALKALLDKRRFLTVVCNNPTLNRDEFYDFLLAKLGIECASPLKSRRLLALEQGLVRYQADGRPAVLIVDEAQRLPGELLEEIRLLLNIETPQEKYLQIIMAGQPELGEVLARSDMRQLKQRVSCIAKLEPLKVQDLRAYVEHRLARAGLTEGTLFADDAIRAVYEWTRGIPRLVNSLCDAALQTGFATGARVITTAIVSEAANDLQLVRHMPAKLNPVPINGGVLGLTAGIPPVPLAPVVSTAAVPAVSYQEPETDDRAVPFRTYVQQQQRQSGFLGSLIGRWRT